MIHVSWTRLGDFYADNRKDGTKPYLVPRQSNVIPIFFLFTEEKSKNHLCHTKVFPPR